MTRTTRPGPPRSAPRPRRANSDLYNITGVVVAGGHSFVTLNFAGAIYRVNNATGQVIRFVEGLDYPEDLELIGR